MVSGRESSREAGKKKRLIKLKKKKYLGEGKMEFFYEKSPLHLTREKKGKPY